MRTIHKTVLAAFLLLFAVILFRNAWLNEDAYITFRTVDNFINGYGLTWNTAERVQAYTHPLWMFTLSAVYFFTREIYFTSMIISFAFTLTALFILSYKICLTTGKALLAITILTLSKAFIDYSVSGLENPLTYLILALFFLGYLRSSICLKKLFLLSLLASLGTLNRMDTILIFLPALIHLACKLPKPKSFFVIIAGFSPFIIWECFSLFYYGFLFPNTAYAKLNAGINSIALARQGLYYLGNSWSTDPLTLIVIATGIIAALLKRKSHLLPIALGILLYLAYIIKIGGDFMSGRFLAAPLFTAVIIISHQPFANKKAAIAGWLIVLFAGLSSPYSPLFSGSSYGSGREVGGDIIDSHGIADERAYWYQHTGLLRDKKGDTLPGHAWTREGQQARAAGPAIIVKGNIGFFGFSAGPEVHIVDPPALAEPLLARLPATKKEDWRIGHFDRTLPAGYLETLQSGNNSITDPQLCEYYDKLSLIIRGPLFNKERIYTIWQINTRKYI